MSDPSRRFGSRPPRSRAAGILALVALPVTLLSCGAAPPDTTFVEVSESSTLALMTQPPGDRIVFTLLGGLWAVGSEGGAADRLTDVSVVARDPASEPGGRRIAFASVHGSRSAITLFDPDSPRLRILFETTDQVAQPAWSPDGSRIVFLRRSDEGCDLWLVATGEGDSEAGPIRLTSADGCEEWPVWTAEGITYSRGESTSEDASTDLWNLPSPQAAPTPLVEEVGNQWAPVAGPGGDILYLHEAGGTVEVRRHPGGEIVARDLPPDAGRLAVMGPSRRNIVLPADGKIWRIEGGRRDPVPFRATVTIHDPSYERRPPDVNLTRSGTVRGIFAPRLSPDGRRVAFAAMGDIWVMPLDSTAAARAVITGPAEETMPAWSPDGRRLAYVSNREGDFDLWVSSLDGSAPIRLTEMAGDEREPAWSPGGDRIAFSFFDNWTTDLFWIDSRGGNPRRVTSHEEWNWDLSPTWSPGGERLAFVRRTGTRSTPHVAITRPRDGGKQPTTLDLAEFPITAVAWSPSGELVYRTGGVLGAVRLDSADSVRPVDSRLGDTRAFHPSFDARGDRLLYLSPQGLRLRSWPAGAERVIQVGLEVEGRDAPPPVTIRNVRLIDGTGAAPSGPFDIRIEGGRIVDISSGGDSARQAPSPADEGSGRLIDGSGLTALPGLIDMHTHLFHYGLRAYLGSGVTTVRDVGFESHLVASRWEGVRSGRLKGPRIVYAGEFLDGPGGPWMGNFVVTVTSPEQVRREVRRLADFGAGWIKTYVRMPRELRMAAIEAAHAHGLPATQHEIYPALAHGADGKEHVRTGWKEDLRAIMRISRSWVVPTLETGSGSFVYMREHPEIWEQEDVRGLLPEYVRTSFRNAVEEADSARAAETRERHEERVRMTRRLREEDVNMAVGTDPTNPYVLFGIGVHWELEHMVQAGHDPVEAIHLATGAAARALGLDDELGTVAVGKLADLLLVEGDPANDIRDTRRIRWIVSGGRPMRPADLHLDLDAQSHPNPPGGNE